MGIIFFSVKKIVCIQPLKKNGTNIVLQAYDKQRLSSYWANTIIPNTIVHAIASHVSMVSCCIVPPAVCLRQVDLLNTAKYCTNNSLNTLRAETHCQNRGISRSATNLLFSGATNLPNFLPPARMKINGGMALGALRFRKTF